ncbi:MAG: NHL repeat-containing protein [Planctomycetota bacterium]|jgi:sugar lactone lactonase YvrE
MKKNRLDTIGSLVLLLCFILTAQAGGALQKTPQLFMELPIICPTPDGMAMDKEGNIILSCPNYADKSHPAVLMKIDKDNKLTLFYQVPVLEETGVACPMGMDFDKEGNLYITDNQGWMKPNNKGRILKVIIKNGKPTGYEVVAYGMSHPNGIKVKDGYLYVTQSMLPDIKSDKIVSAVYRFKLSDKNIKVSNTLEDKNLFVNFKTLNPDCQYGVDGLVFDSKGDLFVGNFGDATIHKVVFDTAGNASSNTIFAGDDVIKSIDGICVDDKDNIYAADFSNNAICVISPDGKVSVLAKSGDCDGSKGGLDQPGEPLVRGNELIVVNFDMVTGPDKLNSGHDKPYTLSVIELE